VVLDAHGPDGDADPQAASAQSGRGVGLTGDVVAGRTSTSLKMNLEEASSDVAG